MAIARCSFKLDNLDNLKEKKIHTQKFKILPPNRGDPPLDVKCLAATQSSNPD